MKWEEDVKLKISDQTAQLVGCTKLPFSIFGFSIMIGSGIYLLSKLISGNFSSTDFIGLIAFSFGYVLTTVGSKSNPYSSIVNEIVVDKSNESIEFISGFKEKNNSISFPFSEFKNIYLDKQIRSNTSSSSSSNVYYEYNIYLTKKDGSLYFIDQTYDETNFKQNVQTLIKHIDLVVVDKSGVAQNKLSGTNYTKTFETKIKTESKFIEEKKTGSGIVLSITKPDEPRMLKMFIPISLIFLGTPIWFIITIIQFGEYFFTLYFVVPFCVIFVSMFLLFIIKQFEKYTLTINSFNIVVEYSYPSFLNIFFNRKIEAPSDSIIYVQVNRLLTGTYQLSLELNSDKYIKDLGVLFYFYNFGNENLSGTYNIEKKNKILWLWQTVVSDGIDKPNFEDLFFLEKIIQDNLELKEKILS
ncbi:MAG: hypothetical protein SFU98_16235 [Leptospiraceae bacterium]|nr:hypothetical protein [Leptospiraceae bacterium]